MSADGYGAKGEPEFDDGQAPDVAVDPTLVGQYAGVVGNRVVGTSTQRASFSAIWAGFTGGPWDGLEFQETDTGITYKRIAGAWKAWDSGWISFTPSFTGITVGSGTLTARLQYRSGRILVEGTFTLGAGSSVSSNPYIQHPANATTMHATRFFPLGSATFLDAGVMAYAGAIHATNATHCEFAVINASGTFTTYQIASGTVPFTIGSGDVLMWRYEYQPA